jgi:hypothetical protein
MEKAKETPTAIRPLPPAGDGGLYRIRFQEGKISLSRIHCDKYHNGVVTNITRCYALNQFNAQAKTAAKPKAAAAQNTAAGPKSEPRNDVIRCS